MLLTNYILSLLFQIVFLLKNDKPRLFRFMITYIYIYTHIYIYIYYITCEFAINFLLRHYKIYGSRLIIKHYQLNLIYVWFAKQ